MPTFESTRASYRVLWDGMVVKPDKRAAAEATARRILANKRRYKAIELETTVPWFFVGLVHLRESNLDFGTYLGNGQSLRMKTTIVPKDRGPFDTFEQGAIDALRMMRFLTITDWSFERIAYCLEGFNGYGYRGKGVNSPYLWAGTNRYTKGKYVADHVFDANAVDKQLGCMAVFHELCALDSEVNARVNGAALKQPPPPDVPPVTPPATAPKTGNGAGAGAVIVATGSGAVIANQSAKKGADTGQIAIVVGLSLVIAIAAFFIIRHLFKKD